MEVVVFLQLGQAVLGQLLGGKNEDTTQNASGNYQQQSFTPKANTQYQTPPAPPSDDEFPEDIPF